MPGFPAAFRRVRTRARGSLPRQGGTQSKEGLLGRNPEEVASKGCGCEEGRDAEGEIGDLRQTFGPRSDTALAAGVLAKAEVIPGAHLRRNLIPAGKRHQRGSILRYFSPCHECCLVKIDRLASKKRIPAHSGRW